MKIKCKKCGKRFDAEMYSGLCPKCGTYNGMSQQDGREQPVSVNPGTEPDRGVHREKPGWRSAEAGHADGKETPAKSGNGRHRSRRFPVLLCLFLILPAVTAAGWFLWKRGYVEQLRGGEIYRIQASGPDELIFEGAPLEHPILVSLEGMDRVFLEGLIPDGMQLICVKAAIFAEAYNFDAGLQDVSLKYIHDGDVFYREPLYADAIQTCLYVLGLSEEDELSTYNPGNGEAESGYWFFLADEDAENLELVLIVENRDYPYRAAMEGRIPLDEIGSSGLAAEEVEE